MVKTYYKNIKGNGKILEKNHIHLYITILWFGYLPYFSTHKQNMPKIKMFS